MRCAQVKVLTCACGECAQDNNFIRKGYRIGYSTRDILVSVFTWHNETGNIHSHLIGDAACATAPATVSDCAVSVVDVARLEFVSRIHRLSAGFLLFLVLTVVVALKAPIPFTPGADAISQLEHRLTDLRSNDTRCSGVYSPECKYCTDTTLLIEHGCRAHMSTPC